MLRGAREVKVELKVVGKSVYVVGRAYGERLPYKMGSFSTLHKKKDLTCTLTKKIH